MTRKLCLTDSTSFITSDLVYHHFQQQTNAVYCVQFSYVAAGRRAQYPSTQEDYIN